MIKSSPWHCSFRSSTVRLGPLATAWMVVTLVGAATGQSTARTSQGFWISAGAGAGLDLGDRPTGDSRLGGAVYAEAGVRVHPQFSVGAELTGWLGEASGETLIHANALASIVVYPIREAPAFLKGGFGGAALEVGRNSSDRYQYGFATIVGAGFDTSLASRLYVTPTANLAIQFFDPRPGVERTNHVFLLLVGLTWR